MSTDYWEDRLAKNGKYDDYEKAIKALRKSRKSTHDQGRAYEALTACGLTSEEADEMINLEMEDK